MKQQEIVTTCMGVVCATCCTVIC